MLGCFGKERRTRNTSNTSCWFTYIPLPACPKCQMSASVHCRFREPFRPSNLWCSMFAHQQKWRSKNARALHTKFYDIFSFSIFFLLTSSVLSCSSFDLSHPFNGTNICQGNLSFEFNHFDSVSTSGQIYLFFLLIWSGVWSVFIGCLML